MKSIHIYITIVCLIIINIEVSKAQSVEYKWVSGSNIFDQKSNYGTKGSPSSTNIPGARENSMSWVDLNNNLWLFGGHGYNATNNQGMLNDLWKYDITSNTWVWVSGSNTFNHAGSYGTQGKPSTTNVPPARQNGVTWVDNQGNLWLFGGQKTGTNVMLNDLWKYTINTNEWTWMSGSNQPNQTSIYGTKNIAQASNVPGARFGSVAWKDQSNNLWVFGGQQYITTTERINDLWKYEITKNEWTWVSGDSTPNQTGIYGTQNTPSSTNMPGARQAALSWVDGSGQFWLYAGYGFAAKGTASYLNDLWQYNITTQQWTWISGSDQTNQPAVYGNKGVASNANIPGARQMSIGWLDLNNHIWLLGGWGYIGPPFGRLNDLWKFNTSTNQWTWMGGHNAINQPGDYGSLGVGSASNHMGSRRMSVSWKDQNGHFWAFGGNGYDKLDSLGLLNDLWSIDVGITTGLNTSQLENDSWSIYPNPSNGLLYITGVHTPIAINIMDIQGKNVLSFEYINLNELDVSNLQEGIYFIRVVDESQIEKVFKWVKN